MSWFQQLVGKLKSFFGGKNAPAVEAGTPPGGETAATAAAEAKAAEPTPTAVATEDKPEADSATEAPAETAATEAPAVETEPVVEEPVVETPAPIAAPVAEDVSATTEEPAAEEPAESAAEPEAVEPPAAAVAEPVVTDEPAATVESAAAIRTEATDPALSTLDVDGITAELIAEGPYGPGSGKPATDGTAPSADFTVKGKESSKLFHTEKSPYFSRTKADVWFKSEADAESAGFQAWDHKKRAAAKK